MSAVQSERSQTSLAIEEVASDLRQGGMGKDSLPVRTLLEMLEAFDQGLGQQTSIERVTTLLDQVSSVASTLDQCIKLALKHQGQAESAEPEFRLGEKFLVTLKRDWELKNGDSGKEVLPAGTHEMEVIPNPFGYQAHWLALVNTKVGATIRYWTSFDDPTFGDEQVIIEPVAS